MGSVILTYRDHQDILDILAPVSWVVLIQVARNHNFTFMDVKLWLLSLAAIVPMVFAYNYTMWIPIVAFLTDLYMHYAKCSVLNSLSSILTICCIRSLSFYL